METDLLFYTRRAREERRAASVALGEARQMHERLADEYEKKVKDLSLQESQSSDAGSA